jgi:hypothetical protein
VSHNVSNFFSSAIMLLALFWSVPLIGLAEQIRMDVSDPAEPVPTACLATGKACSAERSTVNGLMINPASLAPAAKAQSALHLSFGNIVENTTDKKRSVRADSNQYSLGAGQQFSAIGVGFMFSGRNSQSSNETDANEGANDTLIGNASIKAAISLSHSLSFGLSYGQNYVRHDSDANEAGSNKSPQSRTFRGETSTVGIIYGDSIYSTIALMHRPASQINAETSNSDTFTSSVGSNMSLADLNQSQFIIPAKTTIGYETVLVGGYLRTLVFRSDISIIEPTRDTFAFNANHLSYRQDRSSLERTSAAYQYAPSAGLTLHLFESFLFHDFSVGVYTDDTRDADIAGKRHMTFGVARYYQLANRDFSFNVSVDQSENTRRYLINFF